MTRKVIAKFLEKIFGVAPKTLGEEMSSITKSSEMIAGSSPRCCEVNRNFDMIQSRVYADGTSIYRGTGAKWLPEGGEYKPSGSMIAVFKDGKLVAARDDLHGTVRRFKKGDIKYENFVKDKLRYKVYTMHVDMI